MTAIVTVKEKKNTNSRRNKKFFIKKFLSSKRWESKSKIILRKWQKRLQEQAWSKYEKLSDEKQNVKREWKYLINIGKLVFKNYWNITKLHVAKRVLNTLLDTNIIEKS